MMLFKIAFRNILRNGRRSFMTACAIAVGAIAMILFGEYVSFIMLGLESGAVRSSGHLTAYHKGYFDFGSGNPSAYSISDYKSVMRLIENDPELKPLVRVVTPTVSLYGIAGNFSIDTSKTFIGVGFVPSDRWKMMHWDEYGILDVYTKITGFHLQPLGISDSDENHGVIGIGMARILGLCAPLKIADCPTPPKPKAEPVVDAPAAPAGIAQLAAEDLGATKVQKDDQPRIDLLGATAEGAPNVVTFYVNKAVNQGFKELDDSYVGMNITLAQQLLYGRGEHKAIGIQIQLLRTEDMAKAHARLDRLFAEHHLPLEVHDFKELSPQYTQIVGFMSAIFAFISVIIGVIVLFTVINTMSMSVMERTNEIGTARAMGVRRSGIRRQFLIEGWMLGAIGATAGLILSWFIATWFNSMGVMYTPPGQANPVPLVVLTQGVSNLLGGVWLGLLLMATIAAIIPANRAAKMPVVDALRHV